MSSYRVTKYDPRLRSSAGHFPPGEWTSVSDVGRTVSLSEYLASEDAYVEAAIRLAEAAGVDTLALRDAEDSHVAVLGPEPLRSATEKELRWVRTVRTVKGTDIGRVIRLCLREAYWCRLQGPDGFFIHFGHDYYMYVGSDNAGFVAPPMPIGIYSEPFESPHHPHADDEP